MHLDLSIPLAGETPTTILSSALLSEVYLSIYDVIMALFEVIPLSATWHIGICCRFPNDNKRGLIFI